MGGRFSRLNQAEKLMAAKTELIKWQKMTGEERSTLYATTKTNTGNKKTNRVSVEGYVRPFGPPLAANIWVKTLVLSASATGGDSTVEESPGQLLTHINDVVATGGYFARVSPGTGAIIGSRVSPTKLARVTVATIGEKKAGGVVSRLTKQKYTYRKRDSLSSVFGQQTGGDAAQTFEDTATALKNALKQKNTEYRIYFKAQQLVDVAKL